MSEGKCPFIYECEENVTKGWHLTRCVGKYELCPHYVKKVAIKKRIYRKPREWLSEV